MVRIAFIFLVMAHLFACGGGVPSRGTTEKVQLDTVTYRAELDSARNWFRTGRMREVDSVLHPILQATDGVPELRKQRLHALSLKGQLFQRNSQLDSAMSYYQQVMAIAEAANDTFWMGSAHTNIGVVHEVQGDYAGALAEGLASLRLKELRSDSIGMARTLHNMSLLQWRRDSLAQAIDLLQRSIAIKRSKDPSSVHNSLNGMGVLLIETGALDSALAVLKESLAHEDRMDQGAEREMQLSNLGLAFERKGQLDSAAYYYTTALAEARDHGNYEVEIRSLYGLGDVRRMQGRNAEAAPLLDSSLAIAERIGSLEDMKEAHASLATLHEHMDEHAKALEHYRTYHTLSDSLMNAGVSSEMSELRLRYDTEHRDRENAELRAQQELADLRAARNRWIAIGIGVIAIAIAAIAWAMAQRNRQRAYQREAELEQQALRLQMDPHFLFNALNTIPGLYATGDAVLANDHVGHLSKYLRAVLETSRRRTIPLAQEIELVKHYLQISANRRSGQFTWTLKVMPYVRPERVAVPPMLVQPLVENALEHAFPGGRKGHVQVLFDQAGSVLHIEVSDNGVGREAAAKQPSRRGTTSLGLDLVRRRVELFDQQANLSDAVRVTDLRNTDGTPNGTTIILRMRVRNLDEHAAAGDRG
jgi:two-component sensor histidine kinase/Tfp pilus assembly protein PilF